MNQEAKDRTKQVTFDDKAHIELAKGIEIMRKAVGSTYGPGGRNVLVKKRYVHPILTRDGVAVAREIAGYGNKLPSEIAGEAAKLVYQASEKTNKTAGDGTTATVIELAALYTEGYKQIVAGTDAMIIKRKLDKDRDTILEYVQSKSVDCSKEKLDQVAYIACGDTALASMVSDLVYDVGADGAITISYQNAPNVQVEKVTGYLFNQGFRHLQGEAELDSPLIIVAQKRIASRADIIPLLELIVKSKKQFILIGDVSGAAMDTLVGAISQNQVDGVPIPPVAFGADGHDYFEDVAIYTGARVILESDSFKDVTLDWFGKSKAVRVSREKAIIYGDNETGDAIADRIKLIKDQMDSGEMTPSMMEALEQRYAKLAGKVSIIKVGAATEVEREELFFRVEDAVEACKSALSSGIVAGGATTLLFASVMRAVEGGKIETSGTNPLILQPFVRDALQAPFRLLMSNAAEDGGYRLNQVLQAGYGKGFNLRDVTDEPIDLMEAGIVDATKVVLQTVKNAFSVAGALLTTGSVITEIEDETPQPVPA